MGFIKEKILNLYKFVNTGHTRSIKAKKNMIYSYFLKGFSIIIGFLYVPLLLDILEQEKYGLWLTISSMVGWISFFDIGLGNGLRNKLAESIALSDMKRSRELVSTTYAYMIIIFGSLMVVFGFSAHFINWKHLLNTSSVDNPELLTLVIIIFLSMCLQFIFKIITQVLRADQRPTLSNAIMPISNLIIIGVIYLGRAALMNSLVKVSLLLCFIPNILFVLLTIYLFNTDYKQLRPSLRFVNYKIFHDIVGLGIKFFAIQIADMIIYSSTNFLIARFYSPSEVPVYMIARKYFSIVSMLFGILLIPMWSATTDAYVAKDMGWIKKAYKKIYRVSLLFIGLLVVMLLLSNTVFSLWVGNEIKIPFLLSLLVSIRVLMYIEFAPIITFLNGVGKINLSLYFVITQAICYIPIAILLNKIMDIGISSLILAGIIIEIPMKAMQYIQYKKIINQKDTGIWAK